MPKKNKIWIFLFGFLLCLGFNRTAFAEGKDVVVNIPVQVIFSDSKQISQDKGVEFTLETLNGSPAPEQKSVFVKGSRETEFGKITLNRVGTYEYRLRAVNLDSANLNMTGVSDFRISISVFNEDEGFRAYIVASDWNHPAETEPKVPIEVTLSPKKKPNAAGPVHTANRTPDSEMWIEAAAGSLLLAFAALLMIKRKKKQA